MRELITDANDCCNYTVPGATNLTATPGSNRISLAWDAPSDGATQNTSAITFATASADWGNVSGVIVADAASAGNVLLHGSLTTARDVKNGDVFKFNAGDLDITFA